MRDRSLRHKPQPTLGPLRSETERAAQDASLPADLRQLLGPGSAPGRVSTLWLLIDGAGRIVSWPRTTAKRIGRTAHAVVGGRLHDVGVELLGGEAEQAALLAAASRDGVATSRGWLESNQGVVIEVQLEVRVLEATGTAPPLYSVLLFIPEPAIDNPLDDGAPGQQRWAIGGWLGALFQYSMDGILLTDLNGTILAVNPAGLRLLGYTDAREVAGIERCTVIYETEAGREGAKRDRQAGGGSVEARLRRKDGSTFQAWITFRVFRDGHGRECTAMIVRDLAERRRSEDDLRRSEERFRVALLHVPMIVCMLDTQLRVVWTYGEPALLDPDKIVGKQFVEIAAMRNGADLQAACASVLHTGVGQQSVADLSTKAGATFYDVTIEPLRGRDGVIQNLTMTALDVSERVQTIRALHDSEERFRHGFEDSGAGMALLTLDGRFLRVNPVLTRILGYAEAELQAMNVLDVVHADDRDVYRGLLEQVMSPSGAAQHATVRKVRKDGGIVTVQLTRSLVRSDSGRPAYVIDQMVDISRQLETEERSREAQKMEAIGRFAGGIAHDFNNMLTAIRGGAELLRLSLQGDPTRLDDVSLIDTAADRAARLTAELLAFCGRQSVHATRAEINDLVGRFGPLLGQAAEPAAKLELELALDAGSVEVDASHLEQALFNLVANARDALPGRGSIRIATGRATLLADEAARLRLPPGDYVHVTVRDDGAGMDAHTKAHIFEPFFTTKAQGKGTGLGLSMVYGFIQESHGNIAVDTKLGHGTTFHLLLPRFAPATTREATQPEVPAPGGPVPLPMIGKVLVVDDVECVRETAKRLLNHGGFTVLCAASGEEALAILQAHPEVQALLSDVAMPGMDGDALVARARRLRPGLAVGLMSGYDSNRQPSATMRIENARVPFLPKPFRAQSLLAMVQGLMAEARTAEERPQPAPPGPAPASRR